MNLLLRLAFVTFFLLALHCLGLRLGGNVDNDAPAVATTSTTCTVGHARSPALASGELLGLKRVVRTAICRVRPCVSHADYHAQTVANIRKKDKPPPWITIRSGVV